MKLVYPVVLYPSGVPGGYTVLCPDMPGLVTEGRNLPEALDMAVDAASGWVLGELEEGRHEPHATNIARHPTNARMGPPRPCRSVQAGFRVR